MGSGLDYINRVFLQLKNTENLPPRSLQTSHQQTTTKQSLNTLVQCTNIKRVNRFLFNYTQQKLNDAFYFNENNSIILSNHPWLTNASIPLTNDSNLLPSAKITLNYCGSPLVSIVSVHVCSSIPIKLLEIREKTTNKVIKWSEFERECIYRHNGAYKYPLPQYYDTKILAATHYIFVLTKAGHTEKLEDLIY